MCIDGHPLGPIIPAGIGEIPAALGAMLSIPPINPGDYHIDGALAGN